MTAGETARAVPSPGPAALVAETAEDLYENAPCGYLSTLTDGTVVRANATFLAWTGYRADDVVGQRTFSSLLTGGGRIYYETHFAPLLFMQRNVREIALDIVCADGRRLPVLVNATMHGAAERQVVRITVFDATDRREYERELLRARQRAERSEATARELARTLQESLIPPSPPAVPGLDVAGVYRPAGRGDEVGGDFYDVFEIGRDDWAVVLGDVCGKGVQAAGVTALARYTIRAAAMRTRAPRQVLETLNEALLRQRPDSYCTVGYVRVRRRGPARFRLVLSLGGHHPPLLLRGGAAPTAVGRPGSLIGLFDEVSLHDVTVDVHAGDALVLFTDGVTEGRSGDEFFGEQRAREIVGTHQGADAGTIAAALVDAVVAFQEGMPRDDIAVVVLKVPAER